MDNGQQTRANEAYFTAGVGNAPVDQTPENIPNLNIDQSNWGPERNLKEVGSNIISLTEKRQDSESDQNQAQNQDSSDMGKIIPLNPTTSRQMQNDSTDINVDAVYTEGDHIAKSALIEVRRAESKFYQTGNASDFYEDTRNLMEANLNNSWGRKLAA